MRSSTAKRMRKFKIINGDYLYPYSLNNAFKRLCVDGDLEEIKYVLTSPDLKFYADIHWQEDYPFRIACEREHWDVVQYFIFDRNIEKTVDIQHFLSKKPFPEVEKMFQARDLKESLDNSLKNNSLFDNIRSKSQRIKI